MKNKILAILLLVILSTIPTVATPNVKFNKFTGTVLNNSKNILFIIS